MHVFEWSLPDDVFPNCVNELCDAIPRRYSCRDYASAPSDEQWEDIKRICGGLSREGIRLVPVECEPGLFRPLSGLLIPIKGVRRYAAVFADNDEPLCELRAGAAGELLSLYLVSKGLGCVWVAGTYRRGEAAKLQKPGERLLCAIALGVPAEAPQARAKRKPLETLISGSLDGMDKCLSRVPEAVRLAPSAVNLQPWRMKLDAHGAIRVCLTIKRMRLDLGIAMAHAALAVVPFGDISIAEDKLSFLVEPHIYSFY